MRALCAPFVFEEADKPLVEEIARPPQPCVPLSHTRIPVYPYFVAKPARGISPSLQRPNPFGEARACNASAACCFVCASAGRSIQLCFGCFVRLFARSIVSLSVSRIPLVRRIAACLVPAVARLELAELGEHRRKRFVRWIDHLQRMRALSGGCVSCVASNVVCSTLRDARVAVALYLSPTRVGLRRDGQAHQHAAVKDGGWACTSDNT